MSWWLIGILWYVAGIIAVCCGSAGGWLAMMSDSRSNPYPWTALIGLFLCWTLWPIQGWVARFSFYVAWYILVPIARSRAEAKRGKRS